jgi:phosphoesterase RecJ-like protein
LLIACHVRPDGDALGSLLGLGLGCEQLGKSVVLLSPDGVPERYRFLPTWERVVTAAEATFDLAVGVDADGRERLGSAETAVLGTPCVIDIDHHTGPEPFGDIQWVEPTAAATGELVARLLDTLEVPFTREIACCLMTAILTDTGGFRFTNVTANALRLAARLTELGAPPAPIYQAVYEQKSLPAARITGRALAGMVATAGGALAYAALSGADFAAAQASDEDTEGIVNELRAVAGVRAALLFREEPDGQVRVSLRARDRTDMAAVAARFGGGGHRAAAGCTLPGPLEHAVRQVVAATEHELEVR